MIPDPIRVSPSALSLKMNMPINKENSSLEYLKGAKIGASQTRHFIFSLFQITEPSDRSSFVLFFTGTGKSLTE